MPTSHFPDYPFQGQRLNLNGVEMHYLDEGPKNAPPVLMVHGNPTWSFYFRKLVTALRGTHRVIVPDHIGMGLSEKPAESRYEYTLSRRAADLGALVDSLKLTQPLSLVMHDWGGMIGMAMATAWPERIARVVALNTAAFGLPAGKAMPWQLKVARAPLIGAFLVRGLNAFSAGAAKDCVTRPLPADVRRAYLAPYDSWSHRLAVHRFIQDIPLRPGDRAFNAIARVEQNLGQFRDRPMLLCWGMKDFVFDAHFLNRWIEIFPHAKVQRFENAGHYVLEDAGDEIIPLVREFLNAPVAEAAPA